MTVPSRFLFNAALWKELSDLIPKARRVRAAIAYLGTGAASLLPLRGGDQLVVDMSLRSVRSGTTDPREVRKFLRRGVQVFSRGSLHAKFIIIDGSVVAGSANISGHARHALDEAAIITDDGAAVRRASAVFEQLASEPVRKGYLEQCLREYRPPKFLASERDRPRQRSHAKVWIIGGLTYSDLPEREEADLERAVKRATKQLLDFEKSEVDYIHYPSRRPYFRRLRVGDWIVPCIGDGRGFNVYAPGRFLGIEDYARGKGKRRYLVTYETPTDAPSTRWTTLRAAASPFVRAARNARPKTMPLVDDEEADALLRLWNARGRFRRGR